MFGRSPRWPSRSGEGGTFVHGVVIDLFETIRVEEDCRFVFPPPAEERRGGLLSSYIPLNRQKGAKRDRMTSRRPLGSRQKSIQEVFWSKQAWVSRASSRGRDRIKRPNLGGSKSTPKVPQ